MEVEGVVADTPGDGALLCGGGRLVGLALDAQVHDVVTADGAVVDDDVPCPERDGVPLWLPMLGLCFKLQVMRASGWARWAHVYLLDFETRLLICAFGLRDLGCLWSCCRWGVGHVYVRHGVRLIVKCSRLMFFGVDVAVVQW